MDILQNVLANAIDPALKMLPPRMDSPEARVLMLAIGRQESLFLHRVQVIDGGGRGPARGFWQFERGGGCVGVLEHPASRDLMRALCEAREVPCTARDLWDALEFDDILAAGAARLLLWTDPRPLPPLGMDLAAWRYYLRNWRPGKPRPRKWAGNYEAAWRAID